VSYVMLQSMVETPYSAGNPLVSQSSFPYVYVLEYLRTRIMGSDLLVELSFELCFRTCYECRRCGNAVLD
jgi:hypothetical protein